MVDNAVEQHDVELTDCFDRGFVNIQDFVGDGRAKSGSSKFERCAIATAATAPAKLVNGENAGGSPPLGLKTVETIPCADIENGSSLNSHAEVDFRPLVQVFERRHAWRSDA